MEQVSIFLRMSDRFGTQSLLVSVKKLIFTSGGCSFWYSQSRTVPVRHVRARKRSLGQSFGEKKLVTRLIKN